MKVILNLAQSLDGFICRLDGTVDYLGDANEEVGETYFKPFLDSIDVIIMGRTTYEEYKQYGYDIYKNQEIYVWTRKEQASEGNIHFYKGDIRDLLRQKQDKTIWCFGGTRVIEEFMKYSLIDEYHITTVPYILGEGKKLFEEGDFEEKLELKKVMELAGNVHAIFEKKETIK